LNKNLKASGNSFHLFPTLDVLWEWHIHVPFAHWFKSERALRKYIILYKYLTSPIKFFKNHQLINFIIRPKWRTVKNGSKQYVDKIIGRLKSNKKSISVLFKK